MSGTRVRGTAVGVRVGRVVTVAALASLVAVGAGCASVEPAVVELTPDLRHIPALAEVPKDVAIRYAPEFRSHRYVRSSPLGETTAFPVGAASVQVLDDVFGKVFRRVVAVQAHEHPSAVAVEAVLEPQIRAVSVHVAPPLAGRWWFLWGSVTYRFTVTSPGGDTVVAWEVTGAGELLGDGETDTVDAVVRRLLTRCVEDAGIRVMRSFYDVPEAERWARNMDVAATNAPRDAQVTEPAGDAARSAPGVRGRYPGIAEVEVRPRPETHVILEVRVENQSAHPLLLGPSGMALVLPSGEQLSPVPVYAYAASQLAPEQVVSGRPAYIPPPMGVVQPGVYAAYHLIFALAAIASMESERRTKEAFDAQLEKFRGNEFRERRLSAGAATSGDVHFIVSQGALRTGQAHLTVSIVDLETATRYEMRLPVRLKEGVKP